MINHLDNMLRHLFMTQINIINNETQVRFQPPDDAWRNVVVGLQDMALNIYMVDLRENRRLRSNARLPIGVENGQMMHQPAPARVDCHYLISAWSPTQPGPALEPTLDEQALLYQATAVLMNHVPINAKRIYGEGTAPWNALPEVIRDTDLPVSILPVEGFIKLAEFWGAMGANNRWKPAIYLIVTLPVVLDPEPAGPLVTTRVVEYRRSNSPDVVELLYHIGGRVIVDTGAEPLPLAGAWVRLETMAGNPLSTTTTNDRGQFGFEGLHPGRYQFRWRAGDRPEPPVREVNVPSPTGEYDLIFI